MHSVSSSVHTNMWRKNTDILVLKSKNMMLCAFNGYKVLGLLCLAVSINMLHWTKMSIDNSTTECKYWVGGDAAFRQTARFWASSWFSVNVTHIGDFAVDLSSILALRVWILWCSHLQHAHAKRIDIYSLVIVLFVHLRSHELRSA